FVLIVVPPPTQRPATSPTTPPAPPSISAKRIGHQRSCAAFASQRVKSAAVRCGPSSSRRTLRPRSASSPATTPPPAPEPTTTTSKRSLTSGDPEVRPVLREGRGEGSVEVDLGPRAARVDAGRDEVAVEGLDRERAHPHEVGRADVVVDRTGRDRGERGDGGGTCRLVHRREQRIDVHFR